MAVKKTKLLHESNERFGRKITRGWADSVLKRQSEQLFEANSFPQENLRLEVPRTFLEAARERFQGRVHLSCAPLVFSLDEIGISEWEDRTERRAIVPSIMRGQSIFHGIQ
jgi:hypothetical protein